MMLPINPLHKLLTFAIVCYDAWGSSSVLLLSSRETLIGYSQPKRWHTNFLTRSLAVQVTAIGLQERTLVSSPNKGHAPRREKTPKE